MNSEDQPLLETAQKIVSHAYSPFSGINLAAVILSTKGNIFYGVNVENSSYPEGVCAETSAISHMISSGDTVIEKLFLLCDFKDPQTLATPCGGCRQRLSEFGTQDTKIVITNMDQSLTQTFILGELLPHSFTLKG